MKYYIYKAIKKNVVIYVGITNNLNRRMLEHEKNSKWFGNHDIVTYTEVRNSLIASIYEIFYIGVYKPMYNIQHNTIDKNYSEYGESMKGLNLPKNTFIPYKPLVEEYVYINTRYEIVDVPTIGNLYIKAKKCDVDKILKYKQLYSKLFKIMT